MAQGVAGDAFFDSACGGGAFDGVVVNASEQVVAALDAGFQVDRGLLRGEEPEPIAGFGGVAVF